MLEFLKQYNYNPPSLKSYRTEEIEIDVSEEDAYLMVNGIQWMFYDFKTHKEVAHFFSHYSLAKGHCITTGLGFGLRETWLLTKKEVNKLTVLEKNKSVIEYHQYIESPFLKEIELIHCDASEYVGKCDTLLLDHYEFPEHNDPRMKLLFLDLLKITKNITHQCFWFWPFEDILLDTQKCTNISPYEEYLRLRKDVFPTLPNLSKSELMHFIDVYNCQVGKFSLEYF
jgi:hypothetical protein